MQVASLVPQVFFDVISRILPGGILLFWYLSISDNLAKINTIIPDSFKGKEASSLLLLSCSLCFISYFIGIVFEGIWVFIRWIIKQGELEWKTALSQIRKVNGIKKPSVTLNKEINILGYIYDRILTCSPRNAARLVKLRAENHLCGIISIGFLISILLTLPKIGIYKDGIILFLSNIMIVVSSFYYSRKLSKNFAIGIADQWILIERGERELENVKSNTKISNRRVFQRYKSNYKEELYINGNPSIPYEIIDVSETGIKVLTKIVNGFQTGDSVVLLSDKKNTLRGSIAWTSFDNEQYTFGIKFENTDKSERIKEKLLQ